MCLNKFKANNKSSHKEKANLGNFHEKNEIKILFFRPKKDKTNCE